MATSLADGNLIVPVIKFADRLNLVGMTKSVNKRKKLLAYLKKKKPESYQKVLKQLNLRK